METILRRLRRSSNKKKKTIEIDAIDEKEWAQSKTLDLAEDLYDYTLDKKYKNNKKKKEDEKREDNLENLYGFKDKLENLNGKNKKNEKYYVNSFSRMNEDITNVSTDFTNEYYKKKKKNEHENSLNNKEKKKIQYMYNDFEKYTCDTKEYSENDEVDLYEEEIDEIKSKEVEEEYEDEIRKEQIDEDEEEIDNDEEAEEIDEDEEEEEEEIVDEGEGEEEEEIVDEGEGEEEIVYEEDEEKYQEIEVEKEYKYDYEEKNNDNEKDYSKINEENVLENIKGENDKEKYIEENTKENIEENEEYLEEKLDIYTVEEIDNEVEVSHVKGKGRCMFTKKNLDPGSIIFIEKPLLIITPGLNEKLWNHLNKLNNEENFELPLKWHFAALCSITILDDSSFKACIDKWVPEPDKEPDKDVYNVLDKVCDKKISKNGKKVYYYKKKLIDPNIYDRIIQVWHYNAFGHHTDSEGLVLYNRISMLAHSCNSTACWHYGENDSFVLRARIKLNAGDELTISYLGDDDLYKSSNIRREKLTNWLFVCMCSRCTNPIDNSRGFKCSTCGIGTFYIKNDYHDENPIVTKCNICFSEISESTAYEYIEYENSYIERLQETDKSDLPDALAVYVQADKIFTQHWIMFQLYTILFEGYRDSCQWEKAIYYQMQRIKYAVDVIPRANYVLAWLYEELGEIHANSINTDILLTENDFTITYEEKKRICSHFLKSIHILEILCGYSHDYLKDSLNKYYRIDSLTTIDAPQIEE
ncbi:SET domain protein, putative [Plasmodium gallinaceum]|uniref:SET domain protein, putative n=1 Tax=Plasmodium gallinaceum TaxID=5849 RepID=A0A1J1GUS1_PLAGA|nr:SET domain protein, putative [Plasmodium gallinaceum]CRG96202.1 SET domain protein, putative [Plasmodium gallinaceum]